MNTEQIEYLQLVTSHQVMLAAYIRSIAPGVQVDDVLQETNIVLWNKMESFETGSNFKAFAHRVAYLKTMESLRRQKRNQWLVFDSDILDEINSYYQANEHSANDTQNALKSCMMKLNENERKLLHLRYTNGETVRNIAVQTAKSEGALQQIFFRLRNNLRSCITQHLKSKTS